MPSKPGTGSESPFGNGAGDTEGEAAVANNFVTNPGGSRAASGAGQPESYLQSIPQKAGVDPTINPAEIPAGGKDLLADPKADAGNPVGTTAGAGRPPFKGMS